MKPHRFITILALHLLPLACMLGDAQPRSIEAQGEDRSVAGETEACFRKLDDSEPDEDEALDGCATDGDIVCGDGTCDDDEDSETCPSDCEAYVLEDSELLEPVVWCTLEPAAPAEAMPEEEVEAIEDPNAQPPAECVKIKALHDEATALTAELRAKNPNDPRLLFLDTQNCILGELVTACADLDAAKRDWLLRVLNVFMSSLDNALRGKIAEKKPTAAENAAQWRQIVLGQLGGFWWKPAFDEIDRIGNLGGGLKPTREEAAAIIMMIAHIEYDLDLALSLEGVGDDATWALIGAAVETCQVRTGRFPGWMSRLGRQMTPVLDPQKRRDAMRDRAKQKLKKEGIEDPYKGGRDKLLGGLLACP